MRRLAAVAAFCLLPCAAGAAQTRRFVADTPAALDGAVSVGVSIAADGTLRPLPPLEVVRELDEPLGLALAVGANGTAWVGTGHPAHLWRFESGNAQLVEVQADQITALLVSPDGDTYVATASPAALLRVRKGADEVEQLSLLAEGNLWDLAWFRGELVAAAGNPGRLLRLGRGGLETVAEIPDQHARCLAVSGNTLFVGSSGRGLVMRWAGSGTVGAFYDSSFTEIADLVASPDGTLYAAALTGDPTLGKPAKADGEATVTVTTGGDAPPQANGGTATAEILRISPVGAATSVHRFSKQIAGALAWGKDGLVVGTGIEGEIWQLTDGAAARLDSVDAAQVSALAGGGEWVLTQSPVRLLRRAGTPRGTLVSPVLDAGQPAVWGLAGADVTGTGITCYLRFRSGSTAEPDDTWSAWGESRGCEPRTSDAPPARFLQWRLELHATSPTAGVRRVDVAYRQVNLPPTIAGLTLHEPAEVFLKSPPPSERIVDVQHPDLAGIFTTLSDAPDDGQDRLGKKYYRVGYQSVSWRVEDPNQDALTFRIEILAEGSTRWWVIRDRVDATVLAFDTHALADGRYRLRLVASDAEANPEDPGESSRLSRWFTVDNTPPRVTVVRSGGSWLVTVEDGGSPITVVEWNRDAERWSAATPEDGLLDGRVETFRLPAVTGEHTLAVRAVDAHHNRTTAAVEEKP